jgi:hypothetical protein
VISTELENAELTAGTHSHLLTGLELASGTYICEVSFTDADGRTSLLHRKMTLSK